MMQLKFGGGSGGGDGGEDGNSFGVGRLADKQQFNSKMLPGHVNTCVFLCQHH